MTNLQRVQLRQSELRQKINDLLGVEDRSDEQNNELADLTGKMTAVEVELRAALVADDTERTTKPTEDAEDRERRELRSKTGIADFVRAAAVGGEVTGAAREFAEACGVPVAGHLPLAMLPETRAVEDRAITAGPAVDGAVQPAVPFVFERTAAAAVGVTFTTVGMGQVQIPSVTTAPPAAAKAKDAAAPNTAAVIALASRAPKRITGQFEIRVEDLAVYPELESVLSESIRNSIGNTTDEQVFNGTGAGDDLSGLFKLATDVNADSDKLEYGTGVAKFAGLVDGQHAYGWSDIRAVIGSDTFALLSTLYRGANADTSLVDYLMMKLGALRVSNRMPAAASSAQKGIVTLMASGDPIRVYVWNALQMVRDPYGGAGAGKVTITATALVSDIFAPHGTSQVKEIHPKIE